MLMFGVFRCLCRFVGGIIVGFIVVGVRLMVWILVLVYLGVVFWCM